MTTQEKIIKAMNVSPIAPTMVLAAIENSIKTIIDNKNVFYKDEEKLEKEGKRPFITADLYVGTAEKILETIKEKDNEKDSD